MQQAAQRVVRAMAVSPTPFRQWGNDQRAKRLRRALVCAATVPVVLIAAGCSSDSGDGKDKSGDSASPSTGASQQPSASASPTVQPAAFQKLPEPCSVLSGKTLATLVPKGTKSGKEGPSDDTASRSSCSWSSLDNNGVKGSQFRWLNVSLLRFDSDAHRGSGNTQAHTYYTQQVKGAQTVTGAKNGSSVPMTGAGDEAMVVRYDLKKKEGAFKQQTVVARAENVVITVDYNGAGLAGEKTPNADDLTKAAVRAAKEVVAAVSKANGRATGAGSPDTSSASPSGPAAKSPSKSPSGSASPRVSPSRSAAKKS